MSDIGKIDTTTLPDDPVNHPRHVLQSSWRR